MFVIPRHAFLLSDGRQHRGHPPDTGFRPVRPVAEEPFGSGDGVRDSRQTGADGTIGRLGEVR